MSNKRTKPFTVADSGTGVSAPVANSILVGNGAGAAVVVTSPAATGVPLVSGGAAANPSFSVATIAGGGTGTNTFVAYAPICGGTSTTGALQSVASAGTSGQVLISNGAGALPSWTSVGGGGSFLTQVVQQIFTSDGTYTPTAGMDYCIVEAVGGGGGGGGTPNAASQFASGGGAGGYSRSVFSAATIGASKAVDIGAGGAGVAANNGSAGSDTTLGTTLLVAKGGGGALKTDANYFAYKVGAGGVAGTGDFTCPGGHGYVGFYVGTSGNGGNSQYGAGGLGVAYDVATTTGVAGNNGTGYGSGGGGAYAGSANATNRAGGNGMPGVMIITEFLF